MTEKRLADIMKKEHTAVKDVMLMTAERGGKYHIVRKEKSR